MKKKQSSFTWIGLVTIFFVSAIPFIANASSDADSAQQALQQLRILQQRLSQSGMTQSAPAATKSNRSNSQTAATTDSSTDNIDSSVPVPAGTPPVATSEQKSPEEQALTTDADNELIDVKAFEGVSRQLFPLTPEQIIRLKQQYHSNEFAGAATAGTPPKPTATSQIVNLSPGSTPPVIRLSQGFVSSLVFLDSTGAPWPISAYDLGDPAAFNIQWDKTSNTLMIQALKLYNYGNLAVRLRNLNTPVMLTLIPGQKAVDYRVDLRIQGLGPNAKSMPTEEGLPPSANDVLLHVLDGVPPAGSQRLTVSGGDARAWIINDKMYVRTNLTVLSPGWIGSMTSADGMHAYEMQKSPVLLVSWHGKVMQLKVEGL